MHALIIFEGLVALWEVNALKISATGTDLVGTDFQCLDFGGTDIQY